MNKQKLLHREQNNIVEAKDKISELPDSILHHILSFLESKVKCADGTKCIARTCILSKRWNHIWKSIPTLNFPSWSHSKPPSSSEINKFMDFVDRTLHLHYGSSIQKIYLETNKHFNASRVHSWISGITSRNVKELTLHSNLQEPFFVPVSLFTCHSLTKLRVTAWGACRVHIPKDFSLPKLQSLELCGIRFTDDNCWNEQQFSNCPVLENLSLENCTWLGVRKFCISTPALKKLEILNYSSMLFGLRNCHLRIYAPNLVYLKYYDSVAKDYDLSSFVTLNYAVVYFNEDAARNKQWISYGAAVSKFFRALSYVKILTLDSERLPIFFDTDDSVNDLPTFHNLNQLEMIFGPVPDKLIFALLKAAPNLKRLEFDEGIFNDVDVDAHDNDDILYDETEDLFRHLQSVRFRQFCGEAREFRWANLILKNAKSLETMTIEYYDDSKTKELQELVNLPRASERCVLEFA